MARGTRYVRTMLTMQNPILLPTQHILHDAWQIPPSTSQNVSCQLQLCCILSTMLGKRGVDWMKRRSKVKFTQIHVSVPVRLLEDFDQTLRFNQSRSAMIANLIQQHLAADNATIQTSTTRQLIAALHSRDDVEPLVKSLLLQILTK